LSAPHIAAIVGGVILLRGREKEGEGKEKGEKGDGGESKERGLPSLYFASGYGPACSCSS